MLTRGILRKGLMVSLNQGPLVLYDAAGNIGNIWIVMYNYSGINVHVYSLDRNSITRLVSVYRAGTYPHPHPYCHSASWTPRRLCQGLKNEPLQAFVWSLELSFSWIQKVFSTGKTVTKTSNHLMKVPGFLIHCKDLILSPFSQAKRLATAKDLNLVDTGATILPGETCCKMMRLRWSLQTILLTKVQRTEGLLCEKIPPKDLYERNR